ncbi:GGDEF domain-containing protein [Paenibacillaceae bacterium]|nr:GGDEF domain-containing protein [Paenibacillaceae bacterium]
MKLTNLFASQTHLNLSNSSKWIRKFLNTYWIIVCMHFVIQLCSFLFLPYPANASQFYIPILIGPTIFMFSVILLGEFIHQRYKKYEFYTLFLVGTMIAVCIVHLNYDIRIIAAIFLLPIFSSVIFFNKRLTIVTSALQLVAFFLLYVVDPLLRTYLSSFDLITIPTFLLVGTGIALIILISGRELLQDLQNMLTAKQDLMVENAIMSKMSKIDGHTKLYNHMAFHEYYEKALEYVDRVGPCHLALIDIDNFKLINDNFGHRVGDIVLSRVARVIRDNIAPNDIAARYGGEEFALLLFERTFEDAYELVEKIRNNVSQIHHRELQGKSVTVSIGLKTCTSQLTKEGLFEDVDTLLYQAKRSGKNKTSTPHHAN